MTDQLIPEHVAIIMDRNGAWAKQRALSRVMGHSAGMKTVKRIVTHATKKGVKTLSLFAFSTENWKRPPEEVSFLMKLLEEYIKQEGKSLLKEGIQLRISGRLDRLPQSAQNAVNKVIEATKNNSKMILNIALDYGGRAEITQSAVLLAKDIASGKVLPENVDEELFGKYIQHPDIPDVDIMIRTGGEKRISNFLLWRLAYAELYFTEVFWPDFDESELDKAFTYYASRTRRFGMTDEQLGNK